jgi:hypothetical protein
VQTQPNETRHPVPLTKRQAHLIAGALNGEAARYERLANEQMIGNPVAEVPGTTVDVWHHHAELLRALSRNILVAVEAREPA